jgi:hypothetical protein
MRFVWPMKAAKAGTRNLGYGNCHIRRRSQCGVVDRCDGGNQSDRGLLDRSDHPLNSNGIRTRVHVSASLLRPRHTSGTRPLQVWCAIDLDSGLLRAIPHTSEIVMFKFSTSQSRISTGRLPMRYLSLQQRVIETLPPRWGAGLQYVQRLEFHRPVNP